MSDFLKKGWHPKGKEGGKESWRGDFKGVNQISGWMGKGKKPGEDAEESTHISRPLATLKDPSLFGPPPKNVNYHGGIALPNEITPHRSGLGAPLTQEEIQSARYANAPVEEEEEIQRPAPPPLPFRSDRTGLKTENLPLPPVRRNVTNDADSVHSATRPSPGLPPRLPSRQNSAMSPAETVPSPPAYETNQRTTTPSMNQSAMSRLGNAGVSVPAFGIGKSDTSITEKNPWKNEKSQSNNNSNPQMSELQSRFSRMTSSNNTNTSTQDATITAQSPQPPTWQQTQSSLRTAQNLHQNPSQVTLADAQQAANTAQSAHTSAKVFKEKHADKVDAAERKATALNKRYNVTGRLNRFLEDANEEHDKTLQQAQPHPQQPGQVQVNVTSQSGQVPQLQHQTSYTQQSQPSAPTQYQRQSPPPPPALAQPAQIGRKPPPPPPPKKPANMKTGVAASSTAAPPPVPLGTRPSFN